MSDGWDDLDAELVDGVVVRRAAAGDVAAIVGLLADDVLGRGREHTDLGAYEAAFDEVDGDPAHDLVVLVDAGDQVVGTLQLTVLPGLARGGVRRGQVEAVRVASHLQGRGVGEALLRWAFRRAERRGCGLVQLTSDKQRGDAHRFYERLGMTATHEGFKLALSSDA